jgi:nicotinate-nucleotide adenylyltransferase
VKVGVLGGTFDPVHLGHLVLAEQAREQLSLDRVLWVPAGDPWRKAGATITSVEHRLAMVHLAIGDNEKFDVITRELERQGPSYTVETLRALREERPGEDLVFLAGLDALFDLPHWREPAALVELAELGVALRGEDALPAPGDLDRLLPGLSRRVRWIEMTRLDLSATDLRARAAAGRSLRYLVPPSVAAYIERHNLYRSA